MKKSFAIFLILLLILAAGVLVAPGFINWNSYKPEITKAAIDALGRDLSINGNISVKLVPSPTVSISGLQLANISDGASQPFAQIQKVDVRVAFLPLLGGKVKVESVYLDGPKILLEKLADGRVNWEFGSADSSIDAVKTTGSGGGGIGLDTRFEFSLDRLEIRNGTIRYQDHQSGNTQALSGLQAIASLKSLTGPFRTKGEARFRGMRAGFDLQLGKFRNGSPLPISLVLQLPDVAGAGGGFSGRVEGLNGSPRLIGDVQLAVSEPQVLADHFEIGALPAIAKLPLKAEGELNLSGPDLDLKRLVTNFGDIRLEGDVKVGFGDVPTVVANLGLRKLNLDALLKKLNARKPATIGKNLKSKGKQKSPKSGWPILPKEIDAKLNLHIDGVSYRGRLIRQSKISAQLQNGVVNITRLSALLPGGSDVSLSGKLSPAAKKAKLTGRAEFGSSNFRNFLSWLGIKVTAAPGRLNNVVLTAGFSANETLLRINGLKARLDNSNVNGGGSVRLQLRPSFGLNLQIDKLNLDDYVVSRRKMITPSQVKKSKKSGGKKSKSKSQKKPVQKRNAISGLLANLRKFDANIRLKLNELSFDHRRYQGVHIVASVFGGTATIKNASVANFGGGPLKLTGKIEGGSKGRLSLRASYRAGSLLGLSRLFKFHPPFNPGRLRNIGADVDLNGNLERLNISARLAASGLAMTSAGQIVGLADGRPRFNLTLAMKHPSFAQLSKIFTLGVTPLRGADAPVEIAAKLKGDLALMATDLKLRLAGGETALLGEVSELAKTTTYNFSFSTRHGDVVRLLRGLGVPAKRLAKAKQILLLSKLTGDMKKFKVSSLQGSIGETVITGNLNGILRKPRPLVRASLTADRIVLDPYLNIGKSPRAGKKAKGNKAPPRRWSKEFIDLSAMRLLDAELSLAAGQIQWRSLLIGNNKAKFNLNNGKARFDISAMSAQAGSITANGIINAHAKAGKRQTAGVKFSANNVHLRQMLRAFGGIDRFSGIANISGNLSTRGNNQWSMVRALNGNVKFKAEKGAIEGIDLKRATEILANPVNVFAVLRSLTGAFSKGRTEFISMTGDYKVAKGIARTNNIKADFGFANAAAKGHADLPRWLTDMNAEILFKGLVKPLPLPVNIKGHLDDPEVVISEKAVGTFVGNTIIGVGTAPINIIRGTGKAIGGALDTIFGGTDVKKKK